MSTLTLADLAEELQRGQVYECSLHDPHWHLDGLQDGERVYIDPRPAIILSLLHELTHRRKRSWGERRVTAESNRLLAEMSATELAQWWRAYCRVRRRIRPKAVDDDTTDD